MAQGRLSRDEQVQGELLHAPSSSLGTGAQLIEPSPAAAAHATAAPLTREPGRHGSIWHNNSTIVESRHRYKLSYPQGAHYDACSFSNGAAAHRPLHRSRHGGPDGTWTADAGDHTYLRDWSQARLVWQSEVGDIGTGRGQAPRYGARNAIPEGTGTFGGTASPIIADGRLYLYYVRPIGTAFNRSVVEKIQTDHSEREGFSRELLERNFSLELENVLVAIDLKSGATL